MMKIRNLWLGGLLMTSTLAQADTMEHFMSIYSEIPKMEMKADPQSQAWARSARNVLAITSETVAETLLQANDTATRQGKPLFCLPVTLQLNAAAMTDIIIRAYENASSPSGDKSKMTVSQIAWLGVTKFYPCQEATTAFTNPNNSKTNTMQHVSAGN